MTAVTDDALARFSASIQNNNSMKLSFAGNAVPCTRNVSRPRTFSSTRTKRFPSENRCVSLAASGWSRYAAIDAPNVRLADPAKSRKSSTSRQAMAARPRAGAGFRLSGARQPLQAVDDGVRELAGLDLGCAVHEAGEVVGHDLLGDRRLQRPLDVGRGVTPAEVLEHHHARQQDRARVDLV